MSLPPRRIFLPGLASPASSPCSSTNLRCRFSATGLQRHKSALPIFPTVGIAADFSHCRHRCRFSATGLQVHKSALPIFPDGLFNCTNPRCRFFPLSASLPIFRDGPAGSQIRAADFPRRACSGTNPRCRFFPLSASLPLPLPLPQRVPSSLSRAGGRQERGGPGPEGSPPAGKIASQQGLSPRQPPLRSAAWLPGNHCRARARPIAQEPKGPQGPQALRPQRPSAQRGRARARVWSLRGAGLVAP